MNITPITGFGVFRSVLQNGIRTTVGPVGLTVCIAPGPTDSIRIGVGVGKRFARHATARSRMRRLLRESVRMLLPVYEEVLLKIRVDAIVILWKSNLNRAADIRLQDVFPCVKAAFDVSMQRLSRHADPQNV